MPAVLLFLCLLFAVGYAQATGLYPDVEWMREAFFRLYWPALVAGLAAVVTVVLPTLFKRDTLAIAWSMVALSGCLLVIPLALAREQQAELDLAREQHLQDLRRQVKVAMTRQAEALRAERASRRERARTDRFVQYEGRLPAATLDRLREIDARMAEEVKAQADAYREALDTHPTTGIESWIRFRTLADLEREVASHKALYEQTRNFAQFVNAFEDRYTAEIEAMDLQPPADRIAIAEMERILQAWERARLIDLRRLDVELLGTALNVLTLLREAWGQWAYSPRDNLLSFEDPAVEGELYRLLERLDSIHQEVDSIRKNLPANP